MGAEPLAAWHDHGKWDEHISICAARFIHLPSLWDTVGSRARVDRVPETQDRARGVV
jgi:hypothetical protein